MARIDCVIRLLTLIVCFGLLSGFTVMDRSNESQQTDLHDRVIYLVNILRQIKKLSASHLEDEDTFNSLLDRGGGISSKRTYPDSIDLQKKDYGLLPPNSEWCRMMGFRTCRQHS